MVLKLTAVYDFRKIFVLEDEDFWFELHKISISEALRNGRVLKALKPNRHTSKKGGLDKGLQNRVDSEFRTQQLLKNVEIVRAENYQDALCQVVKDYSAYIIDGRFPENSQSSEFRDLLSLGPDIVEFLLKRNVPAHKIFLASSQYGPIEKSIGLGLENIYQKSSIEHRMMFTRQPKNYRELSRDLKNVIL